MHIILLLLGVLSVAAGIALVVSGLPESTLSFGNVLITCGTIAIVGGLILIALASVLSHLRRIREAIEAQGSAPVASAAPPIARPDLAQAVMAEATRTPIVEPPESEKVEAPGVLAVAPAADGAPREESRGSPAPKPEWPRVDTADRFASGNASSGTTTVEAPPLAERTAEPPAGTAEPPVPAAKPTILKSGVIEGMAYTLYSDGSIEAELAQGVMRFKSIPELRAYMRDNPP
jgi:hypothetical protein